AVSGCVHAPPLSLHGTATTLDNGLTLIVSEDHTIPGVAMEVLYQVGSKDEEPGRTGFAHLYEHLMFMGARYVPYPKFDTIIEAAQLDDVKRFFAHWYVPSNAVVSIVGDVDTAQAQALAKQYFGWIPSPKKPEHPPAPPLPERAQPAKQQLTDKVELPKLILA